MSGYSPAFPCPGYYPDTSPRGERLHGDELRERMDSCTHPQKGMSLRAWLAGQAIAGLADSYGDDKTSTNMIARNATRLADALISQLDRPITPTE